MAEKKGGLKELLISCLLVKDFRQSFVKNPEKFLKENPKYEISADELKQLKSFKVETWDDMKLKDLNHWLTQAEAISRPGSLEVGVSIP